MHDKKVFEKSSIFGSFNFMVENIRLLYNKTPHMLLQCIKTRFTTFNISNSFFTLAAVN